MRTRHRRHWRRIGRRSLTPTGLLAAAAVGAGCAESPAAPLPGPAPIAGDAVLGQQAFLERCAGCHAAQDGFDLAFFAFPDSTIVRRAVHHVDTATAHDIVAHIRTLRVAPTARHLRVFQPGSEPLTGDVGFAVEVFGADAWPLELTPDQLEAIDPLDAAIALPFPLWSFEESNLDWMPETPLAAGILDYESRAGAPRPLLERYYASRSLQDLGRAVMALRLAERDPDNPDAPCVRAPDVPLERLRPAECFEARRWISTLVAQHMLRHGIDTPIHPALHDEWWDVGNAARLSLAVGQPIDNALMNWAVWMYVGWAFEPDRHASVYLSSALTRLGLPRHATFHALRAQVSRPPNSLAVFRDVEIAARVAPPHWTFAATRFGYLTLLERLDEGTRPPVGEALTEARLGVEAAWSQAARKVADPEAEALLALRNEILGRLD